MLSREKDPPCQRPCLVADVKTQSTSCTVVTVRTILHLAIIIHNTTVPQSALPFGSTYYHSSFAQQLYNYLIGECCGNKFAATYKLIATAHLHSTFLLLFKMCCLLLSNCTVQKNQGEPIWCLCTCTQYNQWNSQKRTHYTD